MKGQVTKILAQLYRVTAEGKDYLAVARGRLRLEGDIYVGDCVELSVRSRGAAIEQVFPRKNCLIRPYVANVDKVLIVTAPVPEPDFLLVDKIILNALKADIEPILVYNKIDLGGDTSNIQNAYSRVTPIHFVSSATKNGLAELIAALNGSTVAFAGQSAVGKTSIINALFEMQGKENPRAKVDGLSEKTQRGKNTTRHVEMYDLGDFRIADTCGFSMLECVEEDERNLSNYYDDFLEFSARCRFRGCNHIEEPSCAVKQAVECGDIDCGRYERYRQIYEELKQKRGDKYD